jgi:hypothetical protein
MEEVALFATKGGKRPGGGGKRLPQSPKLPKLVIEKSRSVYAEI